MSTKSISNRPLNHIGLFEGIGGFSLAGRWMGWKTVAWCEWDKNCQRVLKYHFPTAIPHDDITTTDFTRFAGQIDVLTGGFPCQPYSSAGKRLGKEDDRHLWPEMLRAIREIQPRWVVGENVRGLTNWNGGLVFDEVQADLENEGYEVTPYLLPACAVNAPHRRDRIWFVAHAKEGNDRRTEREFCQKNGGQVRGVLSAPCSAGCRNGGKRPTQNPDEIRCDSYQPEGQPGKREQRELSAGNNVRFWDAANATTTEREQSFGSWARRDGFTDVCPEKLNPNASEARYQRIEQHGTFEPGDGREQPPGPAAKFHQIENWEQFPTQSPVCSRDDGIPDRLDGITFPKWRKFSIGAYGNAIVPQVAYQIFKAIQQYENIP